MILPLLLKLDETDRRSLIIGAIILVIFFLFVGLFGALVRFIFTRQSERADGFINNVVRAHVLNTPKEVRRFGFRKNNRAFYRDSLLPFGIALIGLLVWVIENIATQNWGSNIFADSAELFFWYDFSVEGVIVKFFGINIIAAFPPVSHQPEFHLEHLCHYIECFIFLVSAIWYALVCQGYIARLIRLDSLSRSIFKSNLKDYKAADDIHVTPDKPLPPSE